MKKLLTVAIFFICNSALATTITCTQQVGIKNYTVTVDTQKNLAVIKTDQKSNIEIKPSNYNEVSVVALSNIETIYGTPMVNGARSFELVVDDSQVSTLYATLDDKSVLELKELTCTQTQ